MTNNKQSGFGVIVIVVAIVVLAILGYAGYRVYTAQTSKSANIDNTTSSQIANNQASSQNVARGKIVSSDDNKVSLTLPSGWQLVNEFPSDARKTCVLGAPNQCSLYDTFAPSDFTSNGQWFAIAYQTTLAPRDWAEYPLGSPTSDWKDQSDAKVNGYDAFYVVVENSSIRDLNYFIEHNGYIVYLRFREVVKGGNAGTPQDLSKYADGFTQIVNSIKIQ